MGVCREIGDRLGEANATRGWADVAQMRASMRWRRSGMRRRWGCTGRSEAGREANATRGWADVARIRGQYGEAQARYKRVLGVYRQIGDPGWRRRDLAWFGTAAPVRTKMADALANFREAERLFRLAGLENRAHDVGKEAAAIAGQLS